MPRAVFTTTPPALWCEYQPLLECQRKTLADRIAWLSRDGEPGLAQAERLAGEVIVAQVTYWNLRDSKGHPLPIDVASLSVLAAHEVGSLFALVTGFDDPVAAARREIDDARRLSAGIQLALLHPEVADRDCADCQLHIYDESTGRRTLHRGQPIRRPPGTFPPCQTPHVGCPRGTPQESQSLSPEHLQAWLFDLACRATGRYPADPHVARNAVVIRAAESAAGWNLFPSPTPSGH